MSIYLRSLRKIAVCESVSVQHTLLLLCAAQRLKIEGHSRVSTLVIREIWLPNLCRLGPFTPLPSWRPLLKSYTRVKGRSWLDRAEAHDLMRQNNMDMDTLLQALVVPAAELALPYLSGYFVGWALLPLKNSYPNQTLLVPVKTFCSNGSSSICAGSSELGVKDFALQYPPMYHVFWL